MVVEDRICGSRVGGGGGKYGDGGGWYFSGWIESDVHWGYGIFGFRAMAILVNLQQDSMNFDEMS